MSMMCFQCQETSKGTGCTVSGVCGKNEQVAALQDLLAFVAKGISSYASRYIAAGKQDAAVDKFILEALFTNVTNVDFDEVRMQAMLKQAGEVLEKAKAIYKEAGLTEELAGAAAWSYNDNLETLIEQGVAANVSIELESKGEDIAGVQAMTLYGLQGSAAYADHALVLGKTDDALFAQFHDILNSLTDAAPTLESVVGWAMKAGELNLGIMALLDGANTGTYGSPVPTPVKTTPTAGKAILVSGHDLKDMEILLKATEGKGINIYTHSEMLPAHGYPELKKYSHLAGNVGGAWYQQKDDFENFPGAVLMTTNCIVKPRDSYKDRLFTTGLVAYPGVKHIDDKKDFTPVIEAALAAEGYAETTEGKDLLVGFGHSAVLGVADKVIEAVKGGAIKRFFVIGGCDGRHKGRNYYRDFVAGLPSDTVVLTLGCAKYRFNDLDLGDIGGIPRLLDLGQCNDSFSAIQIAVALAGAFECGVNDLPLSLNISWYEQKAVAVLLTLLHLGIKNIKLGPTLPAFVSPAVLNFLVENFGISGIGEVEADIKEMMG